MIELHVNQVEGLSQDEIYSLSVKKAMPIAFRVFDAAGFVEEPLNPEGFNMVDGTAADIRITGMDVLQKYNGEDLTQTYMADVIDQYGDVIEEITMTLNTPVEGVTLSNNELAITSDAMGEVILSASYNGLIKNYTVVIDNIDKPKELMTYEQMDELLTYLAGGKNK